MHSDIAVALGHCVLWPFGGKIARFRSTLLIQKLQSQKASSITPQKIYLSQGCRFVSDQSASKYVYQSEAVFPFVSRKGSELFLFKN
jgi:hypothetical protein